MLFTACAFISVAIANNIGTSPPNKENTTLVLQNNLVVDGIAAIQDQTVTSLELNVVQAELLNCLRLDAYATINVSKPTNNVTVANITLKSVALINQGFEQAQYSLNFNNTITTEMVGMRIRRAATNSLNFIIHDIASRNLVATLAGRTVTNCLSVSSNDITKDAANRILQNLNV